MWFGGLQTTVETSEFPHNKGAIFEKRVRMAAMRRFSGSAVGISVKARIFGDPIAAGVDMCREEVPKVG